MPKYILSTTNPRKLKTTMKVSQQLLEFVESKRNPREPLGETLWRLLHERDSLRKKVLAQEEEILRLDGLLDYMENTHLQEIKISEKKPLTLTVSPTEMIAQ